MNEVTIDGTLNPDGTLLLNEPVQLPPGAVRVTVETLTRRSSQQCLASLEEILTRRAASGIIGRTADEIDADLISMRQEWDVREQELDRARSGLG